MYAQESTSTNKRATTVKAQWGPKGQNHSQLTRFLFCFWLHRCAAGNLNCNPFNNTFYNYLLHWPLTAALRGGWHKVGPVMTWPLRHGLAPDQLQTKRNFKLLFIRAEILACELTVRSDGIRERRPGRGDCSGCIMTTKDRTVCSGPHAWMRHNRHAHGAARRDC